MLRQIKRIKMIDDIKLIANEFIIDDSIELIDTENVDHLKLRDYQLTAILNIK